MKTIVLASNKKHKKEEFKDILKEFEILSLKDINFNDEIEENGKDFKENALIKAKTIHNFLKKQNKDYIVISDDSGLCVESLNNEPGIYSARYAGIHGNDQENRNKLLKKLKGKDRNAFFNCTLVLYYPDEKYEYFEGKTYGYITKEELGKKEFGYDCIFYSNDLNKTFGQATEQEKNSVSHRGRAIEKLLEYLKNN